ncbi:MAG: hypothetical protein KIT16_07060 [Rhodospirillaceae bacterium]|nr:hypothetical protein [Rhodospirillaceae bacterium]
MADPMAEAECRQLVDQALLGARKLLEEEGAFRPFALTVSPTGDTEVLIAQSNDDQSSPQDDLEALRADLGDEAEAGGLRAAALAFNAWINGEDEQERREAVIVFAEHRDGSALSAHQFYAIEERRGDVAPGYAVTWQECDIEPVEASIFAAP